MAVAPFMEETIIPSEAKKNHLFEGGLRVPAFIHSPLIPAEARGTVFNDMFHVTDWLPTIFGMIGVNDLDMEKHNLDGINQWDQLKNIELGKRTEILHNIEYAYNTHPKTQFRAAIQVGDLKLIYGEEYDAIYIPTFTGNEEKWDTCNAPFKESTNLTYVYNITNDPSEINNIFDGSIGDEELSTLWDKLDDYAETITEPAYERDDWDLQCYQVWADHQHFLFPWHFEDLEDLDKALNSQKKINDPKKDNPHLGYDSKKREDEFDTKDKKDGI
mmetsp:Transcript_35058/g.46291  ORF Transcript_35058/g.46291 Transcript_35058/m.46291 type:complete len:273 (-) Transcript_35058:540-1358(-)